mmetsp:Transcript_8709/g.22309  ORF Transcript_8709/g.22309 Transcript_8709/m.22309 type:complete len:86 (-) Transcript_8709:90-347(-)
MIPKTDDPFFFAYFQFFTTGRYSNGYNGKAFLAMVVGVLPSLPGFLNVALPNFAVPKIFQTLYSCAWFVGFGISIVAYCLLQDKN